MVTVFIPSLLKHLVGNVESVTAEMAPEQTCSVRQVLEILDAQHAGLLEGLLYEGDLIPGIAVFVNNEQMLMRLEAKIEDGSTIHLVPPVVGG